MSSDYFKGLEPDAQLRYRDKLSFKGDELPDPLDGDVVRFSYTRGQKNLPSVTVTDIFLYLVEGVCFYTKEQFKNYKMSDAYNAFLSGKVKQVVSFKAGSRSEGVVVVSATVEASQALDKAYTPWCVVEYNGTVTSGHCTCMAGLGECCTHVAALLFYVQESAVHGFNTQSPTEKACRWIEVPKTSREAPISDMIFFKPKVGQPVPEQVARPQGTIPELSDDQVRSFLHQVKLTAPNTLLLSSITDSEETDSAPEAASEQPQRQEKPQQFSPQRLGIYTNISLEAAKKVQLTSEQCNEIEFNTRGQSSSPRWLQERKGRITGSVLHRVAACRTGADGLVAEIMGYIKTPRVANIQYGSEMEPNAKAAFIASESTKHRGLRINDCGLFVMERQPFLAASPDAIVSCECCAKAVLEVKCPASVKGVSLTNTKHPAYLNDSLQLKREHTYYTQVQAQMAVTGLRRTYFVVFTGASLTIEVIAFDEVFWAAVETKAERFFFSCVFPELQSPRIAKQMECARTTCRCHGARTGRVVECSSCLATFHLICEKLKRTPKSWLCTTCKDASQANMD